MMTQYKNLINIFLIIGFPLYFPFQLRHHLRIIVISRMFVLLFYLPSSFFANNFCCCRFQCDAAYGMKAFFRMLDEEPAKIILFGDACPVVTDPIAKASKFFHLIQVRRLIYNPHLYLYMN